MPERAVFRSSALLAVIAWILIAGLSVLYIFQIARLGVTLRNDFWVYWENNRFYPDVNSALGHGLHVLREAQEIEQEDQASAQPGEATIANPGSGLFDAPISLSAFSQRWRRLQPVYSHIFRGWVQTYDHLQRDVSDGEYQMDYPPLRCLVMTLWAWKVQADFPGIEEFPRETQQWADPVTGRQRILSAEIARPLLKLNMIFEGVSSVAMFVLVWIWMERKTKHPAAGDLRSRWGDPVLLVPAICLLFFLFVRSHIGFEWTSLPHNSASLIDNRIVNPGWWISLGLRFLSVVCLAYFLPRPFRSIVCALFAATLVWLNPASIMDSFGWPQWEAWLPPFFLLAALLVSLDWWLTAGLVLAAGVMLKGQLLFICPVLILCPLFAGWIGRFVRITTGMFLGAGLIVWPWLIGTASARTYIGAVVYAAVLICAATLFSRRIRGESEQLFRRLKARWRADSTDENGATHSHATYHMWIALLLCVLTAGWLVLLAYRREDPAYHGLSLLLMLGILTVPWFLSRRSFAVWITIALTASIWLTGAALGGSFSWWNVGFVYGTQKHQKMQLGQDSLSNLTSLLENRYHWNLHDPVASLSLPLVSGPIDLDIQSALGVVFALTLIACAVAAAIHLRRNDKKFLVAITAPWILFVTLLTQMAARYLVLGAVISACLVAISPGVSLLQLLVTVLACVMLGNQLLAPFPATAPITYSITQPTFPDAGWLLLLLALLFLAISFSPTSRKPRA